jgi:hypothetical protein
MSDGIDVQMVDGLLVVTLDSGLVIREVRSGLFRYSVPAYYSGPDPQRVIERILTEQLNATIADPERALAHWTRIFEGMSRRSR